MPIPPPSQPAAPSGLARTRSLRRPQATGLPAPTPSSTATATLTRLSPKKPKPPAPAPAPASLNKGRAIPSLAGPLPTRTRVPPSSSRTHLLAHPPPQLAPAPANGANGANGVARRPSASSDRRPSSSGGPPASPRVPASPGRTATARTAAGGPTGGPTRGHTRTRSTSAVTSTSTTPPATPATPVTPASPTRAPSGRSARAPTSVLSAAPVLRPPSAQSTGRPPTTTTSSLSRAPSRGATAARPRTRDGPASSSASAPASAATRPAFNTMQQHYSPAKTTAPKPRVAAILAPPASPSKAPANAARAAETGRLQTRLLQLHVLHRDADAVAHAWHASARAELMDVRFAALAADSAALAALSARHDEADNAAALHAWATAPPGPSTGHARAMTLEKKVQVLDQVLGGVWPLAGTSTRYGQLVRRFDAWAQRTAQQAEARRSVHSLADLADSPCDDGHDDWHDWCTRLLSDDEAPLLDAAWHDEVVLLRRRLQSWQHQLELLAVADTADTDTDTTDTNDARPSLHRLLRGLAALVDGMLAELHTMQQLERDAAEQELAWIRRVSASSANSASNGLDGRPEGGVWRQVQ